MHTYCRIIEALGVVHQQVTEAIEPHRGLLRQLIKRVRQEQQDRKFSFEIKLASLPTSKSLAWTRHKVRSGWERGQDRPPL